MLRVKIKKNTSPRHNSFASHPKVPVLLWPRVIHDEHDVPAAPDDHLHLLHRELGDVPVVHEYEPVANLGKGGWGRLI